MKKIRCNTCMYRSGPYMDYLCDYAFLTGNTRKAQLPEECTYFAAGDRPKTVIDLTIRAQRRKIDYELLEQLRAEGLSDTAIAEVAGCSRKSVSKWRWRNALQPGNRRA